jgi:hypothetical protein
VVRDARGLQPFRTADSRIALATHLIYRQRKAIPGINGFFGAVLEQVRPKKL